jgi:hypothetical protein
MVLALVGIGGCGQDALSPSAGVLRVIVKVPGNDEGAVLIRVFGGPVDSVEAAGYTTYAAQFGSDSTVVVVAGDIASGVLVRLHVPDIGAASSYQAVVKEAASRTTFAPEGTAGISISVVR